MKIGSYVSLGAVLAIAATGYATAETKGPVGLSDAQMDAVVAGEPVRWGESEAVMPNPQGEYEMAPYQVMVGDPYSARPTYELGEGNSAYFGYYEE